MSDMSSSSSAKAEVQAHLHAISQLLRDAHRLGSEEQALLADLVDELSNALESPEVSNAELAQLSGGTAHLVQAVHENHEPSMLEAARDRLEGAVVAIESKAPTLAGLTRRLAEMLSNLGI